MARAQCGHCNLTIDTHTHIVCVCVCVCVCVGGEDFVSGHAEGGGAGGVGGVLRPDTGLHFSCAHLCAQDFRCPVLNRSSNVQCC